MGMEIRNVQGHYEVYVDGEFQFSADNLREVDEGIAEGLADVPKDNH